MTARRQFLAGCSAAIAAMSGGRVGNLVFADPRADSADAPILVVVFLRGGCDGLSLVSPYDDPIYLAKRDTLAVRGALDIDPKNATFQSRVGLHPSAAPLKELYDQGALAAIHACGLDNDTRSHFDAMDYIERGTPGSKTSADGWLARHLRCLHPDGTVPSLAAGPDAPIALLGDRQALALPDLHTYGLSGSWFYTANPDARYHDAILRTAANFYTGGSPLDSAARRTIETIRAIGSAPQYATSAAYPEGSFGESLRTIAQAIKMDLGLRAATADLGGWDHHDAQGVNERGGPFNRLVDTLARGLHALYSDLPQVQQRLTVVVMSEFGRRLGKNMSEGTDHGHGNAMLVLGGQVNGGQVYGRWPGLQDEQLNQREDLEITTDFRTVLSEIVLRQFGNPKLGVVFPGITPQVYGPERRLGLIKGTEITPDYGGAL